jgi:hypothetical protein
MLFSYSLEAFYYLFDLSIVFMRKATYCHYKMAIKATLAGFIFTVTSCGGKNSGDPVADSSSSFTAEEVKVIKEKLLKDGSLENSPYQSLVNLALSLKNSLALVTPDLINKAISTGDSYTLNPLVSSGALVKKADGSGYEASPQFINAMKLTPEALELANTFSKALKGSSAFNTIAPLKIQVAANSCNVLNVAA